jgi:cobalt/nickel transport system permease protein
MENKIPSYLFSSDSIQQQWHRTKKAKLSFLDKTIRNSACAVKSIYIQSENAEKKNFIHKINPHIKLVSLLFMVVIISIANNVIAQLIITGFIFLLYILSGLNIFSVYKKILFLTFIFGFLLVIPASLNVITPGKIIFNLITFDKASQFWIYHIPQNIGLTEEGLHIVSLVFLRVMNSISFALLIVFTTSFSGLIKSFKLFCIPDTFLMIIMLAYKYIFILSKTIEETYLALKSRLIGNIKNKSIRKLISGRVFFIFKRSRTNYENTYSAMASRGYTGKIYLHTKRHIVLSDIFALFIVVAFGIGILFI